MEGMSPKDVIILPMDAEIKYIQIGKNLANELRIGNWVNVIKRVPIQVTANHIKSISEGDNDYSPIPLTPEILEKCGFEQWQFLPREFHKKGDYDFKAVSHNFNKGEENIFLIICNFMQGGIFCNYLHQLQNLYFALTGKELQINL